MGNVCTKKKGASRKLTLAIVGLDNAGKTVTTKSLRGESLDNIAPTIGFSYVDFKLGGHEITLYDLGGGKKIRDIWKSYFAEIYALVYVIDASDIKRMDECKHVLANLLHNNQVKGKPILVLANKQDKEGALDEIDICEQLCLEELVNINQCPCRVEMCSALFGQGKKMDPAIKKGMLWLLQMIDNMWDKLQERVQKDVKEKQERESRERKEKMERVEKMRKERAKKEKEERKQRGEDTVSDEDNDDSLEGDPFKRLDYEELQKKEQQQKALKKKTENKNVNSSIGNHSDLVDDRPHLSRKQLSQHRLNDTDDDSDDEKVPHQQAIKSTHLERDTFSVTSNGRFPHNYNKPPSGTSPRLGRTLEPLNLKHNDEDSSDSDGRQHHRTPRPYDLKPSSSLPSSGRNGLGAGEEEAEGRHLRRKLAPLVPLGSLEPLEKAGKKKKKKAKRNQTVPTSTENDVEDSEYQAKRSWSTSTGHRSSLKASKSPELETLREPESEKSDAENVNSFSAKWGLELPDFAISSNHGNLRPNYDSDHDIVT